MIRTEVCPNLDVDAPFSGLSCEDEKGVPQCFLPVGYESHTYVMLVLSRDRSKSGRVWKHYFIDGDYEDHGTLDEYLLRSLDDDASDSFRPPTRSPEPQTWPAAWREHALLAARFGPRTIQTGEIAMTNFRQAWVEGVVTCLPGDEYLIDDGSGPIREAAKSKSEAAEFEALMRENGFE